MENFMQRVKHIKQLHSVFILITGLCLLLSAVFIVGCGTSDTFRPIDDSSAVFWDRQTVESAVLLREISEEFNAFYTGLPIKVERSGNYTEIFRKVSASIRARALPAMAVAYESMTAEYIPTGAVISLDEFIHHPELGFSDDELDDIYPAVLETNRFEEFGGKMYSFPFAKSVLMLYFNRRVLDDAGIVAPPQTWDAFLAQSRQIKQQTGKYALAMNVDCSTIDGLIFSMGGDVIAGRETLFDSPASIAVFELIETMVKEELVYQITPGTYDDEVALVNDQVAFTLRSSSGLSNVMLAMDNDKTRWGLAHIPQSNPDNPATVLYGPNVIIFNTTREQQEAAWEFIKYFTDTDVGVRWALGTGYLPIRKSAILHPDLQAHWADWEYNRAAYDSLAFARPEPNVAGWQQVRALVENAQTEVLTGMKSGRQAAIDLKQAADRVLALHR